MNWNETLRGAGVLPAVFFAYAKTQKRRQDAGATKSHLS